MVSVLRSRGSAQPAVVPSDEAALLEGVGGGDLDALEELYRRYGRRVYAFGLRLLGDPGLSEELVQEAFLRVWRSATRFDSDRGTVPAFVFAITRNVAIDLWRRPSSRPLPPQPSAAELTDATNEVVIGITVRDALDVLTPTHREVLELGYREGLTQVEIARRLGIPLGTVKTRTYYALRALKLALEERGIDA